MAGYLTIGGNRVTPPESEPPTFLDIPSQEEPMSQLQTEPVGVEDVDDDEATVMDEVDLTQGCDI
jgi:hypothetical protein